MTKHWHLMDNGDAPMGVYPTRKEAVATRRQVYEDMKYFVDTRDLYSITRELPIYGCTDECNPTEWGS